MNKYTYINMYIIKKIISCNFILCRDTTVLLSLSEKLPVTYSENREYFNGDLPHFALKDDKLTREQRIQRMFSI